MRTRYQRIMIIMGKNYIGIQSSSSSSFYFYLKQKVTLLRYLIWLVIGSMLYGCLKREHYMIRFIFVAVVCQLCILLQ